MAEMKSEQAEQRIYGALLCGAAGAAFQVAFAAGGYKTPTEAQHAELVRAFTKRVERLVLDKAAPEDAVADIEDFVRKAVLIVLGPAPSARTLN